MHFLKSFQNRRRKIGALWMTVWLCGWVGMMLLHDLSHAIDSDKHHAPCAVCRVLHQGTPAAIETQLAVRAVPVFNSVGEIQTQTVSFRSQFSFAAAIPRGPPSLLLV